jgi:succinate dehydrogenase/fumarate reductase flavoprotein subunit
VISRAEQTEIDEGRAVDGNVLLDLRHLGAEKIFERLHGTRELSMVFVGVDPIYEPIPVRPGARYHMGGIDTDVWGCTSLSGLYAAGECACVSVHGANRLGGNALMETITFGKRAGAHAAGRRRKHARSAARGTPLRASRREALPGHQLLGPADCGDEHLLGLFRAPSGQRSVSDSSLPAGRSRPGSDALGAR